MPDLVLCGQKLCLGCVTPLHTPCMYGPDAEYSHNFQFVGGGVTPRSTALGREVLLKANCVQKVAKEGSFESFVTLFKVLYFDFL